jgi:hypothetical protein
MTYLESKFLFFPNIGHLLKITIESQLAKHYPSHDLSLAKSIASTFQEQSFS